MLRTRPLLGFESRAKAVAHSKSQDDSRVATDRSLTKSQAAILLCRRVHCASKRPLPTRPLGIRGTSLAASSVEQNRQTLNVAFSAFATSHTALVHYSKVGQTRVNRAE